MVYYTQKGYEIEIYQDPSYDENSSDNINRYDAVYFDGLDYRSTTIFEIKLYSKDLPVKSAVIGGVGGGTGLHDHSTIIEDKRFVICVSNSVLCLSVPDLQFLWRTKADTATCFQIFKYEADYIIHGEVEISRLDARGKIVWQQSGADIFTTLDGKDDFLLMDDYILATDWNHQKYKFGYDGSVL
jgi:hypothetical protein